VVALIKILAVFALIVVFLRLRAPVTYLIAGGAVLLGLLFGLGPARIGGAALDALLDPRTVELVLVLYLIALLEAFLRHRGWLRSLADAFLLLSRKPVWSATFLPALLGLLPSAGGARFSAPLVASVLEDQPVPARDKVMANYWFRHIWEMVLPLYPGLVVAASVTGIPLGELVRAQWFYPPLLVSSGFLVVWSGRRLRGGDGSRGSAARLLAFVWPVILPVAAVLLLPKVRYILFASIAIDVLVVALVLRLSGRELARLAFESFKPSIILLVAAVMIFKTVLEATGSIVDVNRFLAASGVPLGVIFFFLPFLVGLLTGVTQAYVGITFPLLAPLAAASGGELAHFSLAYMAGFLGVLLSPTHLCLLLTAEYFSVPLGAVYPRLLRASLLPFAAIVAAFLLATM